MTVALGLIDHGRMRFHTLLGALAVCGAALTACGGKVIFDDGSGGASGSVGPTSAVGGTTTHAASVTATSTSTGAPDWFAISLSSPQFFTDCKPRVGPDPIQGSFDITFQNHGPTVASVHATSVVLVVNAGELIWSFLVEPDGIDDLPTGSSSTVTAKKVDGSGSPMPPGMTNPCDVCGMQATVSVTFDNGMTEGVDLPLGVPCAF